MYGDWHQSYALVYEKVDTFFPCVLYTYLGLLKKWWETEPVSYKLYS